MFTGQGESIENMMKNLYAVKNIFFFEQSDRKSIPGSVNVKDYL